MASPEEQLATMKANLEAKTGRSLEAWLELLRARDFAKHGEIVAWLKGEHGVTHGFANLIAHEHRASAATHDEDGDPVSAQYAGKEALRPVWDRLAEAVGAFGEDVELAPKKGYVSLRRAKQFGLVQPSTKTRVDVGIQLKGVEPSGRLEASGSFNAMVSHRVRVAEASEVDEELVGWLRRAYDAAG